MRLPQDDDVRVLVTSGSRHGATHDVAERVAGALSVRGHDVVVLEVPDVRDDDIARADAVVIGSAVYQGRWLPEVLDLVTRSADVLQARAVWLFSTGPVSDHPAPLVDLAQVVAETGARGHRTFGGRLERRLLSRRERWTAERLGLREGDHRDLAAVQRWAERIAADLDGAGQDVRPSSTGPRAGPAGRGGS